MDFETVDEVITIKAGETSYKYTTKISQDGKYEGKEEFLLVGEYINLIPIGKFDYKAVDKTIAGLVIILDFPQEECPTTPKPNIKPISLNLPPTPVYPTTDGRGSLGPGGSWSGGGGWGNRYKFNNIFMTYLSWKLVKYFKLN